MSKQTEPIQVEILIEVLNFMLENKDITPEEYLAVQNGKKKEPILHELWKD